MKGCTRKILIPCVSLVSRGRHGHRRHRAGVKVRLLDGGRRHGLRVQLQAVGGHPHEKEVDVNGAQSRVVDQTKTSLIRGGIRNWSDAWHPKL